MELQKFERYEFKYILDSDLRKIIEGDVKNFMKIDAFAKQNLNYFVRSLYFDDPSFIIFEKLILFLSILNGIFPVVAI